MGPRVTGEIETREMPGPSLAAAVFMELYYIIPYPGPALFGMTPSVGLGVPVRVGRSWRLWNIEPHFNGETDQLMQTHHTGNPDKGSIYVFIKLYFLH